MWLDSLANQKLKLAAIGAKNNTRIETRITEFKRKEKGKQREGRSERSKEARSYGELS